MMEKFKKFLNQIIIDMIAIVLVVITFSVLDINPFVQSNIKSNDFKIVKLAVSDTLLFNVEDSTFYVLNKQAFVGRFEIGYIDRENKRIGFYVSSSDVIEHFELKRYGRIEQSNYGKPWKKQSEYWLYPEDYFERIVSELKGLENKNGLKEN